MISLHPSQNQVVLHEMGHAKVVAVAGAGKTTTLVQYVLELLANGCDPRLIRVVMFNKAAQLSFQQMLVACNDGIFPALPQVRTFHSMGLKLYRNLIAKGALPESDLTPISESRLALQTFFALKELAPPEIKGELDSKKQVWVKAAMSFSDRVKADLLSPEDTFDNIRLPADHRFLIKVHNAIETWLAEQRLTTFADMLYRPAMYYLYNPEAAAGVRNLVDHILVDEYQDVNPIQNFLVKLLAGDRAQVMVIGDADQTIYSYRGAESRFILEQFEADFPGAIRYHMNCTWRYGHELAVAANSLIWHNTEREKLSCVAGDAKKRTTIDVTHTADETTQVLAHIKEALAAGRRPSEIAILCRVWSQATAIELGFLRHGIHYQIMGGFSALRRPEIRALITVLEYVSTALFSREQGDRIERLVALIKLCGLKLKIDVIKDIAQALSDGPDACDSLLNQLGGWQEKQTRKVIKALKKAAMEYQADEALHSFKYAVELDSALKDSAFSKEDGDEALAIIEAFESFISAQPDRNVPVIIGLIESLQSASEKEAANSHSDQVTVTSMHRAKGLEWPVVIIPGASERYFPYFPSNDDEPTQGDIESERRLFYVAMTRAKEALWLYAPPYPASGVYRTEGKPQALPSRFLAEMDLPASKRIAHALQDDHRTTSATLPYPTPCSMQSYLDGAGSSLELEDAGGLSSVNCDNALVFHKELGPGRIVGTTPVHYIVNFPDDTARILKLNGHETLSIINDDEYEALCSEYGEADQSVEEAFQRAENLPRSPVPNTLGINQKVSVDGIGKGKILSYRGNFITVDFGSKGIKRLPKEQVTG